jgi:hypothetical protein
MCMCTHHGMNMCSVRLFLCHTCVYAYTCVDARAHDKTSEFSQSILFVCVQMCERVHVHGNDADRHWVSVRERRTIWALLSMDFMHCIKQSVLKVTANLDCVFQKNMVGDT